MNIVVNATIYLSEVLASDKVAWIEHMQDKEIHDHTFIPYPYTGTDFADFLSSVKERPEEQGEALIWAIRIHEGYLIGGLGFHDLLVGHRAEIAYWLAKPYRNQGIMTAAIQTACRFAFDRWGLVRITAAIFAGNRSSARVLEKCGFQLEGQLRKYHLKDGRFVDAHLYALVK
jgi:RimJ/RimL family protein N-acetyltransferase